MYTSNLRKVGGSVMLAVPPAILDMVQLQSGSSAPNLGSGIPCRNFWPNATPVQLCPLKTTAGQTLPLSARS